MMKAIVAGSSGFIGGVIAQGLLERGLRVEGWDRRPSSSQVIRNDRMVETRIVDLGTEELVPNIERCAPDIVVHAAGPASVAASFGDPMGDYCNTTLPWHRLLNGIRECGIRPMIVLISSAAVYGESALQPMPEACPRRPVSPYGYHRLINENLAREYVEVFGLDIAVCRLFSTFGPSQRRLLVWELFAQANSVTNAFVLQGTGDETRDYLFEHDIGLTVALIAQARPQGLTEWNLASGRGVTTRELAQLVAAASGRPKPIECRGGIRRGEPARWIADIRRLQSLMAGTRLTTLEEGLDRCARSWIWNQKVSNG